MAVQSETRLARRCAPMAGSARALPTRAPAGRRSSVRAHLEAPTATGGPCVSRGRPLLRVEPLLDGLARPRDDASEEPLPTRAALGHRASHPDLGTGCTPVLRETERDQPVGSAAGAKDQGANGATREGAPSVRHETVRDGTPRPEQGAVTVTAWVDRGVAPLPGSVTTESLSCCRGQRSCRVRGFVVGRTEMAEGPVVPLPVCRNSMYSKIALLAAARVGQLCG